MYKKTIKPPGKAIDTQPTTTKQALLSNSCCTVDGQAPAREDEAIVCAGLVKEVLRVSHMSIC